MHFFSFYRRLRPLRGLTSGYEAAALSGATFLGLPTRQFPIYQDEGGIFYAVDISIVYKILRAIVDRVRQKEGNDLSFFKKLLEYSCLLAYENSYEKSNVEISGCIDGYSRLHLC